MHQTFIITEIHTENYRTKTFIFDKPLPDAQPGQYVMAWLPDVGEKPFSIAGADPLALMVVAVGPFSEALHGLNVGDRVWVRGPLGQGFALRGQHHLLVGGGYGVAPLLFLARTALAAGHTVEVCIGARTAEDVLLAGAFESTKLSAISYQRSALVVVSTCHHRRWLDGHARSRHAGGRGRHCGAPPGLRLRLRAGSDAHSAGATMPSTQSTPPVLVGSAPPLRDGHLRQL